MMGLNTVNSVTLTTPTPPKWFLRPQDVWKYASEVIPPTFLYLGTPACFLFMGAYLESSTTLFLLGFGLLTIYASAIHYYFSRNLIASRALKLLYENQGLRFLEWIDDGPSDWETFLLDAKQVTNLQRSAEGILERGGPTKFEEYLRLFPRCCQKCGFREIHHWEREWTESYNDGYGEQTWGGFNHFAECLRCGSRELLRPLSVDHCEALNFDSRSYRRARLD